MTEPIKQEIINNIFENGDKLITGPILQTVLIDMIDDVNVKDQEILSKTGSWDDAATQIPNLATKTELTEAKDNLQANITNLSESVARDLENVVGGDLTGYATEQWVQDQGYLKEHQDISGLATKTELNAAETNLQGNITSLSESVARDLANVDVDLTGYATETWVESQGYLKEHQDISNLATKSELTSVSESVQTDITNLSESVANSAVWKKGTGEDSLVQKLTGNNEANTPTATGLGAIATGTATTASGNNSHAEGQTTVASGLASHAEGYNTIASAHCSHAEGGDTKASGSYSHAEGIYTVASGQASHTEGYRTTASKEGSHAEGESTIASGSYSHAEGGYTLTSNQYEHAQGQYNHNSTNQIFSVGAGEKIGETVTRRNAVSILEVPNSDTQVVTASFFVQNVGGYDGTNPTPGTNDLATVINGLSSGGGSSETLWKKGTGTDSIVQVLTGDNETKTPTATGTGSIATGKGTTASGDWSHAEGNTAQAGRNYSHAEGERTVASGTGSHAEGFYTSAEGNYSHAEGKVCQSLGDYSHAEGSNTEALGDYSHAEGWLTSASNDYEHAQGRLNHSSENQIFSIGAGTKIGMSNITRRNAISVLAVPNSDTQVVTASFFVQNIGGYDGTNPLPGTNDLATVINGMSTGGGSSETLWKKGTGTDSVVQILSGNNEARIPTATEIGAVAVGAQTTASGQWSYAEGEETVASNYASHAEGQGTKALGSTSHAEGDRTTASGIASHAEGVQTIAINNAEHAQGRFNHNSENQIFSVGAGESIKDPDTQVVTRNRRNAVSVLAVPNADTKINTASFFVQNIGGYDGTNPLPGTNDLATVINGLSSGGGSSETLWKKGTGQNSIVQASGGDQPTATGNRAIATGMSTTASGEFSHAEGSQTIASEYSSHAEGMNTIASAPCSHVEGDSTKASSDNSHAEGAYTEASGFNSHAEGYRTTASGDNSHAEGASTNASGELSHAEGAGTIAANQYEHAQGMFNHSSENQIFSVGIGEGDPTDPATATRRNAISVLAVPNETTWINTGSVFIQNIGGYDGTNPTPGTNDLATVINGMAIEGGIGTSSETWTFTLEDGTTVTKNIVMR